MDGDAFLFLLLTAAFSLSACVSRQYHFVNMKLKWTEAQSYCRENYTDLATINNMNDVEELMKSVNDSDVEYVWIGLQKTNRNKWKWSLGDSVFYMGNNSQYLNWNESQSGSDCVYMEAGKWNNDGCDQLRSFICYNSTTEEYKPVSRSKVLSWRKAQSYCRGINTDLVSVRNQTENQKIVKIMNDSQISTAWIGLFLDSWEWSDHSNSSFRNWRAGIPDNNGGNENCAMFWVKTDQGQWGDRRCDGIFQFFCHDDKLILIQKNLSWTEALNYCRENHVDLVSVHSEQIQRRVMNVAKKASTALVWLGLRHSCALDIWFWVRGEIMCDENWAAGNGSGEEDCIVEGRSGAIQSRGDQHWVSLPQTHTLNFICTNSKEY